MLMLLQAGRVFNRILNRMLQFASSDKRSASMPHRTLRRGNELQLRTHQAIKMQIDFITGASHALHRLHSRS